MTKNNNKKYVVILYGGQYDERKESLSSANDILKATKELGYDAKLIDVDNKICETLIKENPDVVFNGLYGLSGEDGIIQGLLESLMIPYTHSSVLASAIGMDKDISKILMRHLNIPTPNWQKLTVHMFRSKQPDIQYPYIVKQVNSGSSYNLHIIKNIEDYINVCKKLENYNIELIIEHFVKGKEIAVGIMGGESLGTVEMVLQKGEEDIYDYNAKYNGSILGYEVPAKIPSEAIHKMEQYTKTLYKRLGCSGIARGDFRYNTITKEINMLEINTQPGLLIYSLIPKIAKLKNITFNDIIGFLIKNAECHVKYRADEEKRNLVLKKEIN